MKDKISLLSEDERPELISRSEVEAKGHISRLTELKDCAPNLAATNNLPTSSTPTPFSVFSVDSYVIGMGGTGVYEGHTGVVLSVNTSNKTCVVFHTGNSLEGKNPNSWISTCSYDIDGLTFVDVRNFLK